MINNRWRLAIGGAWMLALVAAGCGSSSNGSSGGAYGGAAKTTTAPAASAGGAVAAPPAEGLTIENSAFSSLTVAAGTEFTITNKDSRGHTVTDDAGAFDVGVPPNGTDKLTIAKPGTYKIHCKIHSSMHGTITVT
jgi:plastocyanin